MKLVITTSLILCSQVIMAAGSVFLKAFDVYYSDNQVNIVWETSEEMKNSSFVIERSLDAINFEEYRVIDGKASGSSLVFLETDQSPLAGTSHYRLKQITKEGLAVYSPIRTVKSYEAMAIELNLTPDPCDESYKDELKEMAESQILVVLRDKSGDEYYSKINITNNFCVIEAIDKNEMLPEGEYVITASSKNELYTQKISIK